MTDIVSPTPIDLLPLGPRPTDTPEQFDGKSFATLEAQEAMIPQINAAAISVNQNATAAKELAQAAEQSRVAAGEFEHAALGHMQGSEVERQGAEQAQASAWAAAAAAGNAAGLPALSGNGGKVLMVNPDEQGVSFQPGVPARGQQLFTASQNINKSMFGDATYVFVELWGGSASGNACATVAGSVGADKAIAAGGEGGSYRAALLRVAELAEMTLLTIGAGGDAVTAASGTSTAYQLGKSGGSSSFGAVVAPGGLVLSAPAYALIGVSNPVGSAGQGGGAGVDGAAYTQSTFQLAKLYGLARRIAGRGGDSQDGGGGGGAAAADAPTNVELSPAGVSAVAGSGGPGAMSTTSSVAAAAGVTPSGGGGGALIMSAANSGRTATSGAGARGQAKLTWW